jgi:hypothetical protein
MTYQTIRPSSLPYRADSLWSALSGDAPNPLAPTFGGDGSWSDDDDATYVSTYARPGTASTVIAVDFDPIPRLNIDSSFGVMARLALLAPTGDYTYSSAVGLTGVHLLSPVGSSDLGNAPRFDEIAPTTAPIPTATTYASGDDWYTLFDGETIRDSGFTAAFLIQNAVFDAETEIWRVFELGFRFDIVSVGLAPPCHIYPRDDDQGVGTAAIWPPPSSQQATGQPGGYY